MQYKNVIVGGGASGLSLAAIIDDAVVLSPNTGGLLRNLKKDDFLFDYGGHVYTTKDEDVVSLMKMSNGQFHPERKAFYINKGSFEAGTIPYPVQAHWDFSELEEPRQRFLELSLKEFATNLFGPSFVSYFFQPFNERVWTMPLEKLDYDWIKGRVQTPREFKHKKWGANASFYYAPGHMLIHSLEKQIKEGNEIRRFSVSSFDLKRKRVIGLDLEYTGQSSVGYENLFITTPYLSLPRNRSLTIGIGLKKELPYDFHWVYGDVETSYVHRITLLSRYHEMNAPAGCDSLLLEIPYRSGYRDIPSELQPLEEHMLLSRATKKGIAAKTAKVAGFPIKTDMIETVAVFDFLAYPIPALRVRKDVARWKHKLAEQDVYLAGRWGAHGYWNLEHIFNDARIVGSFAKHGEGYGEYLLSSFYYR